MVVATSYFLLFPEGVKLKLFVPVHKKNTFFAICFLHGDVYPHAVEKAHLEDKVCLPNG